MRILAVIPARAGSKGIPNKNIRIIGDHPLVYYAINNALNSRYITDIIVSTDSADVSDIARQMGVKVHQRPAKLCTDEITLDDVVFDAAHHWSGDLVITMQPTSPTLSVKTLDSAIEYMIAKDLDSLISVVNRPHLAWIEKDGEKIPEYEKRLNRQYLPPHYEETGAFFITKKEFVTPHSRLGKHLDVFEVPEEEALDVDTFADLNSAEFILSKKKIAIYVNGNNKRGIGHIYRSLELADEFYTKPFIYYDVNQTNPELWGNTTHQIIGVNSIKELLQICEDEQFDIFINDILDTSIDYMIALRQTLPNCAIVNFEDLGEGAGKADVVINAIYEPDPSPLVRSGSDYYICQKSFLFYQPITIKDHPHKIFISFGGADPQNYTDRLLEMVADEKYHEYEFIVVIGKAKKNVPELMDYNRYPNITVQFNVDNMPALMSQCDIGIASCGRTSYELAMLGIPAIVMSQNVREERHTFVSSRLGFTYLGTNPSEYIIENALDLMLCSSAEERLNCQEKLLSFDLRHGRKHVIDLINSL